jgi:hypothetical protein
MTDAPTTDQRPAGDDQPQLQTATVYVVCHNQPGCLPDTEPRRYLSLDDARDDAQDVALDSISDDTSDADQGAAATAEQVATWDGTHDLVGQLGTYLPGQVLHLTTEQLPHVRLDSDGSVYTGMGGELLQHPLYGDGDPDWSPDDCGAVDWARGCTDADRDLLTPVAQLLGVPARDVTAGYNPDPLAPTRADS